MSIEEAIVEAQHLIKAGVVKKYVVQALVNDDFSFRQAISICRWAERAVKNNVNNLQNS